ncbi:MAG: UvrD-helicase domain-containing protein [Parachlamydiales bacterium]
MSQKLNPEQQIAIEHVEGPLLVLAGAGSGKTRVVTHRIVHLLELGVPAGRILGVTFTNKASQEMRERVAKQTQAHVLICTFHSLGARILRESITAIGYRRDFTIYDMEDTEKLIKSCLNELGLSDKKQEARTYRELISKAKNALQEPSEVDTSELPHTLAELFPKVYQIYQAKLKECQALDFDDLIYMPVRLFKEKPEILQAYQNRWDFLLIDEYQDTNPAQYTLVKLLVEKHRNLCVVGDPDQSIYAWRGANVENILHFEKDYPGAKVIQLEQNYRSTTTILDAANALIDNNYRRYEKHLWSDRGAGEKIKLYTANDERDEASFVAARIKKHEDDGTSLDDMVVFYRTHFQSRALEDEFLSSRIPYVIVGGVSFYQRREIKDILAFLRVVQSDTDFIAFNRSINLPKRGIGDATLEKLRLASSSASIGIFEYARRAVTENTSEIRLTSKQKGGLKNYVDLIQELRSIRNAHMPLKEIVIAAIEKSGYLQVLAEDRETMSERRENLDSLISKAVEWEEAHGKPDLALFLEELSLKSSLDESSSHDARVKLMTVHNGKGLEFPIAFLIGLEEELFPHVNAKDSPPAIEEERRICYVGVTRAMDLLYLTHCRNRILWGMLRTQRKSRFLTEIPEKCIERIGRTTPKRFLFVDEEEPAEAPQTHFKVGDTVVHEDFGIGAIRTILELDVGMAYRIFFVKLRTEKTLVAKFARLTKV